MQVAVRQMTTVKSGGMVEVCAPDLAPGTPAEVIVIVEGDVETGTRSAGTMTASDLLDSGLVGLWADRADLPAGADLARALRHEAERRRDGHDDPA